MTVISGFRSDCKRLVILFLKFIASLAKNQHHHKPFLAAQTFIFTNCAFMHRCKSYFVRNAYLRRFAWLRKGSINYLGTWKFNKLILFLGKIMGISYLTSCLSGADTDSFLNAVFYSLNRDRSKLVKVRSITLIYIEATLFERFHSIGWQR